MPAETQSLSSDSPSFSLRRPATDRDCRSFTDDVRLARFSWRVSLRNLLSFRNQVCSVRLSSGGVTRVGRHVVNLRCLLFLFGKARGFYQVVCARKFGFCDRGLGFRQQFASFVGFLDMFIVREDKLFDARRVDQLVSYKGPSWYGRKCRSICGVRPRRTFLFG